ncbi:FMN-dependent NADH-azoreductase [Roseiterribacter gracilis]|uniref:FMN dependent NADH:quinone oxidoreductase n=1 Tax=Roseiterribacter gracilis TaxID=2812848 RepID=A0A8S8XFY6_9PROT|nr:FMN-dependent NADH-azoreductase 2 [Rhodospirillales bacterium TMPK1]
MTTKTKLLQVDSSPLGEASVSRELTRTITQAFAASHPGTVVTQRDLGARPPSHFDGALIQVLKLGAQASESQRAEFDFTEELLQEFLDADVIVIGAPMYNFSVPTQLKAWIDRIAQAGRTFKYGENGPVGLAGGKKVIIASSRGGKYAGTAYEAALDHQESYLKAVLGFFGITDVDVVRAEGVAMGPDVRAQALDAAKVEINRIAA